MTIPVYNTDAVFKQWVFPSGYSGDNTDDTLLTLVNQAACRSIDAYCNQFFYLAQSATAQTYVPENLTTINVDPIGSQTGLIIKTDAAGDGTFETTWATSDFELLPQNAPGANPEPRPWTSFRAVGGKTLPWLVNTWLTRFDRVQVTALWGWPAVPSTVQMAALIHGKRLYMRREAVMSISEGVYVPSQIDPDVARMLNYGGYRRSPVLVA